MTINQTFRTGLVLTCMVFAAGCSTVSKPMRFNPDHTADLMDSWFIKGHHSNQTFSCSFVEFDGRGDYVDTAQFDHALAKIDELTRKTNILFVIYCHGWQNNSQSGDVVEFSSFLGRLAGSPSVRAPGYRVHGLYLGWRGNEFKPYVDKDDEGGFYKQTVNDFGADIVNRKYHRSWSLGLAPSEIFSYWSRKRAAEQEVSGIPIARTIYTCAARVKAIDTELGEKRADLTNSSRVMVMGHSFGALLLERSLSLAIMDPIVRESEHAPRDRRADSTMKKGDQVVNPLPFDFVLFVSSAAPAIYAKEMRDFLRANSNAVRTRKSPQPSPVFISLTSVGDWATGAFHPIGNLLTPLQPSFRRYYTNLLSDPDVRIHQSAFYKRTPGHQPLLVSHWIVTNAVPDYEALDSAKKTGDIFDENLDYDTRQPLKFLISRKAKATNGVLSSSPESWKIDREPDTERERAWRKQYYGIEPQRQDSAYWFVRCPKTLIKDHNDVWTNTAMELYAALYRLVEAERHPNAESAAK